MRVLCISLLLLALTHASPDCRFALNYTMTDLLASSEIREEFLGKVLIQEANFMREIGYDNSTGLTLEGQLVDVRSGRPTGTPVKTVSPSNEALHLAILSKVLDGNQRALLMYAPEEALEILQKKIETIEKFLKEYPQFEGFLPQLTISEDSEIVPQMTNQSKKALAQENIHFFFAISAVTQVLEEKYPQEASLLNRWTALTESMIKKAKQYQSKWRTHFQPEDETINIFMHLFANDQVEEFGSQPEEMQSHMNGQNSLKLLFLPILESKSAKMQFMNMEKQRSWDSRNTNFNEMSSERSMHGQFANPQSIVNLFLADEATATVWLHHLLLRPAGQTSYGLIDTMGHNDRSLLSWSSKVSVVLGILGGIKDIVSDKFQKDGHHQRFMHYIQKDFSQASQQMSVHDIAFALPKEEPIQTREDFTSCRLNDIPKDFAWGVATAAYQIEGAVAEDGRGSCIWDDLGKIPGRIARNETANVADDFYHKYKSDIALMKSLGIKHFRLSLSWTRLLPNGTKEDVNLKGVDFYNSVLDELINAGIEPWVTLYHWDLPSTFNTIAQGDKSTWLNSSISDMFNDYADFAFSTFGTKVKRWLTLNEAWTYVWLGYGSGVHAPGRCSPSQRDDCVTVGGGGNTSTEPYIAAHNSLLAHAKAVQTYRTKYQAAQGGQIGMTANTDFQLPYNASNPDDVEAVNTQLAFSFGWFTDPLVFGKYPDEMTKNIQDGRLPTFTTEESAMIKGSYDFIGLNHYTSAYAQKVNNTGVDWNSDKHVDNHDRDVNGHLIGPYAESTWLRVYPEGMRGIVNWIDQRYNGAPIIVFENGVSVPGENKMTIAQAVHDDFRVNYYKGYIKNLIDAMVLDGVNVVGYFAWSFMDNFEWADGYSVRFGMTYVDYANGQQRWLKDSVLWYSQFIQTGYINSAYENPFDKLYQEKTFLQESKY